MGRVVRGAVQRARLGVTAQALCLATAAFCGVLALALLEGARLTDPGAYVAALTAAGAVGFAWRREHPVAADAVARTADRRSGFAGLFVAAYEEEQRAPAGAIAALLARRVLAAARPAELRRAGEPESLPFLALPLAAAVVLAVTAAVAAERWAGYGGTFQLAALAAEELAAAARAQSLAQHRSEGLAPEDAAEVRAALSEAARGAAEVQATLEAQGGAAGAGRGSASEKAAELAERLDGLGASLARAAPGVRERVARAAAALDALGAQPGAAASEARPGADAAGAKETPGGPEPAPADPTADPPADPIGDRRPSRGAPEGASPPATAAATVTGGAPDVTLGGSASTGAARGAATAPEAPSPRGAPMADEGPEGPPSAGPSDAERALAAPRAWPARYDDLAARWQRLRASERP